MPKRTPAQAEQNARDLDAVALLYLAGKTQTEIGRELKIGAATVSRHLEKVRRRWIEQCAARRGARVAEQCAKLDHLERVAMESFEKSWKPRVRKTTNADGGTITAAESPRGDAKYLTVILQCMERRAKMLGLDAPTKLDLSIDELDGEIEREIRELARLVAGGKDAVPPADPPEEGGDSGGECKKEPVPDA